MSFHDWWTNQNNPKLSQEDYLFGTRHIIMLSVAILLVAILLIVFYKKSKKSQNVLLTVLMSILLFFEITSRVVNLIIQTSYSWQNIFTILLPLHICSVAVVALITGFFSKNKMLLNFASIVGLISTLGFLLHPAVGINRVYISFTCLYSIVSHTLGFVSIILLIVFGYTKFEFKEIWKTLLGFVIMFGWGALVNFVILPESLENYMYIKVDPLSLNLNFPYQILYAMILLVYIVSFYLISWIAKKIRNHRKSLQQ